MTRNHAFAACAAAVVLSLGLTACKDTKALQENQQLKSQVTELQKENGQQGNQIETLTADRDALRKENLTLETRLNTGHAKHAKKKVLKHKRHQA